VTLPLSRRRELLEDLLSASHDPLRLSPLLQASSGEILEAVRKLGLEGHRRETNRFEIRTRRAIRRMDQAPRLTENRSLSLAATSPGRTGSMRCSWAFMKTNSLSSLRR
jgi:hypothetical protein